MVNVLVDLPPGDPCGRSCVCLQIDDASASASLSDAIFARLPSPYDRIGAPDSLYLYPLLSLSPADCDGSFVRTSVQVRVVGGKGGFGSQLRSAGSKMSKKQSRAAESRRRRLLALAAGHPSATEVEVTEADLADPHLAARDRDGRSLASKVRAAALARHEGRRGGDEQEARAQRRAKLEKIAGRKGARKGEAGENDGKGSQGSEHEAWLVQKDESLDRLREALAEGSRSRASTSTSMSAESMSSTGEVKDKGKGKERAVEPPGVMTTTSRLGISYDDDDDDDDE
ncbi:hypothetical protein PYCC9005_005410 [Savitreella phatthalungensis]